MVSSENGATNGDARKFAFYQSTRAKGSWLFVHAKRTGKRLSTELDWAYAARGGHEIAAALLSTS
jgi:formylglycine-generating enzyme required for sulfatase activity